MAAQENHIDIVRILLASQARQDLQTDVRRSELLPSSNITSLLIFRVYRPIIHNALSYNFPGILLLCHLDCLTTTSEDVGPLST